ncbi:MAG TPA: glycosyltransferase family 4 protein [Blastocatellia bacterium]
MINAAKRIVHVIDTLGSGGAERFLYTILKYLDRSRFEVEAVTVFSGATHWKEPIEALGVRVTSLDCRRLREWPKGVRRLRRLLRNMRPDLIHTHLWAANVIGRIAGRMSGIPVISSIHSPDHGPDAWRYAAPVSPLKRWLIWLMDRWTARFGCERLLAVSDYVRRNAHDRLGFPFERIDLLYNPVDIDQFQSGAPAGRGKLFEELGLPEGSLVLLNVARVLPLKGLQYAIRSLPAVRKKYPGAHLVSVGAVGDRRWLSALESEAASLGVRKYVRFLGVRRDVPDLLRCCDLFVFPSLYEGLGISLIEAMASGCACVASQAGPFTEVIRQGIDGWLVPPADDRAWADAICSLLADEGKRKSLGEAAAASARARFHPAAAAGTLEGIYKSVLEKASSARVD